MLLGAPASLEKQHSIVLQYLKQTVGIYQQLASVSQLHVVSNRNCEAGGIFHLFCILLLSQKFWNHFI